MSTSPFEISREQREQNAKPAPVQAPAAVTLPAPKPKRKQCSLYLETEMMERVKQVAHRRGVTIGAVIEACVKMSLDQLQ